METAGIVLEFVRVVLSWPVVILALALFFVHTFKAAISDFFRRVVRGEAYGVRVEAATPSEQRLEAQDSREFQTPDAVEKYVQENPAWVIEEYRKLWVRYGFERAYNLIYGTQVSLLENLETKGTDGESYVNLVPFHTQFVLRSNLQATQFADYLAFLIHMKFAEYQGKDTQLSVRITPHGVDFLNYIRQYYANVYQHRFF